MRREMPEFVAAPIPNGSQYTVPQPVGQRAVAVGNAAVVEIPLTGDVFRAMPDSANNAAANDYVGDVVLELQADGDDVAFVCGPKGGGAAGPTYMGAAGCSPAFGGTGKHASSILYKTNPTPYRFTFAAGAFDHRNDSIYAIARTTNATLSYRVVSTLPGNR